MFKRSRNVGTGERRPAQLTHRTGTSPNVTFWLAVAFAFVMMLIGGSSRIDAPSLLLLYPISVLACAAAALTISRQDAASIQWVLVGFGALVALCAVHMVPLPPSVWQSLPGRSELAKVDHLAQLGPLWRPLTLTPMNGWHALAGAFPPLALLLFGAQLSQNQLRRLLIVLLIVGVASGVLGLLQFVSGPSGQLYFYRQTNVGSAVGFFANRNHAALFLALQFPLLALWAGQENSDRRGARLRLFTAVVIALVVFPLILVTGSRAGLILSLLALAGAATVYKRKRLRSKIEIRSSRIVVYAVAVAAVCGVALLVWFTLRSSRAETLQRLFASSLDSESRADFWPICVDLLKKYFPVGSGSGSFVEVYQMAEPLALLDEGYLNHAHNDFLEIGLTFGLPGILLMLCAAFFFVRRGVAIWFRSDGEAQPVKFARAASIGMVLILLGSIFDYPLRTPAMACVFTIFTLWFIEAGRTEGSRDCTRELSER